jgi:hypothetical protein
MSLDVLSVLQPTVAFESKIVATGHSINVNGPNGRAYGKTVVIPQAQATGSAAILNVVTQQNVNSYQSSCFTSQTTLVQKLTHSSVNVPALISIELQITETSGNAGILAPVPHWFDHIDICNEKNVVLQRIYGDNLFFQFCSILSTERFSLMRRYMNINDNYYVGTDNYLKANEVKWYRLIFLTDVLQNAKFLDLASTSMDITYNLYTVSGGIVSSGSCVPSLTGFNFEVAELTEDFVAPNLKNYASQILANNALCWMSLTHSVDAGQTVTFTPGQKSIITLKAFRGWCAGVTVYVRASGYSNTNNGTLNLIDLGDGNVDINKASGQSLMANGNPFYLSQLQIQYAKSFESRYGEFFNGIFIPFSSQFVQSMNGNYRGGLNLTSDEKQIWITPAAACVQEIHTITNSGTPASGGYSFSFMGDTSDCLLYSSSTANMATALNAMPIFLNNGITCAASATMAGSSLTITFTKADGRYDWFKGNLLKVIPNNLLTSGSALVTVSTTRSQLGRRGFSGISGGSCSVIVYAHIYASNKCVNGVVDNY